MTLASIRSCPKIYTASRGFSACALTERVVEACQGRVLLLACPRGSVIRLKAIHLVDSRCFGSGNCCPRRDDCTGTANTHYQRRAQLTCNGHTSCSLPTDRRRIPCGIASFPVYNDYQRVTYWCIGELSLQRV